MVILHQRILFAGEAVAQIVRFGSLPKGEMLARRRHIAHQDALLGQCFFHRFAAALEVVVKLAHGLVGLLNFLARHGGVVRQLRHDPFVFPRRIQQMAQRRVRFGRIFLALDIAVAVIIREPVQAMPLEADFEQPARHFIAQHKFGNFSPRVEIFRVHGLIERIDGDAHPAAGIGNVHHFVR